MKNVFFTILSLLSIPAFIYGQIREVRSDSKITDVTVYSAGARIFGEKRLEIPAGNSTVKFTAIPSELDIASIQVSAEGAATILSVNHELDFLTEKEQNVVVKALIKQRDALVSTSEKEKIQIEILEKEMQFVQANMKVTGNNTTVKVAELAPVFDYFVAKIGEISREKKWRTDSLQSWAEKISKINSQINDQMSQQKTPAGVISVNLDAPEKTSVLFKINYVINNAGWYPTYDIRVKNIESSVQLTYKANVYQNSGIDWKDVTLRFSSANPSQTGILPVLTPWWLDIQMPLPIIREYGLQPDKIMKSAIKMDEANVTAPAVPLSMTREEAGTTFEFLMGKPFSVPSNGKNFLVDISTETLSADYSYVSVPKIDPVAHLKARLRNWEQLNLMPGEANVYFEGTFTGKTYLNTKDFSDTLEISLGIDRNISIQRNLEKELSSTRFLASKTEASKSWKLTVRNNKSQKINIILTDQLPLSANADIEVTNSDISGGKLDAATGEVTWQIEVKPAEKAERKITYTIRYPKGKKVNLE